MKIKPNFYFRIYPAKLIAELLKIPESERGQWVMDLALDLIGDDADKVKTKYGKKVIDETNAYREKYRKAGKLGGLAKASNAIASLENAIAIPSNALASNSNSNSNNNNKHKNRGFQPPTLDEVKEYCQERRKGVDPEKWFDFYEAKGWMIGKNKMKSWKAAVRTWESKETKTSGTDYGQY